LPPITSDGSHLRSGPVKTRHPDWLFWLLLAGVSYIPLA
jgi:hypothetical protein